VNLLIAIPTLPIGIVTLSFEIKLHMAIIYKKKYKGVYWGLNPGLVAG